MVAQHDVHAVVGESAQATGTRRREPGERRGLARHQHGDPLALPPGQLGVVQHHDLAAERLPPPGAYRRPHVIIGESGGEQLATLQHPVLPLRVIGQQIGYRQQRRSDGAGRWASVWLRHGAERGRPGPATERPAAACG